MAFHYLKNIHTGDTRTIRSETLPRYDGDAAWRVFDTETERDACAVLPSKWGAYLYQGAGGGAGIINVPPSKIAEYTASQYKIFDTHEEASEAVAACFVLEGLVVATRTHWERDCDPVEGVTYYDTREAAEEDKPESVWILGRFEQGAGPYEVALEDADNDYPERSYIHASSPEDCKRALPRLYGWSAERGRYTQFPVGTARVSRYRFNRNLIRAMQQEHDTFYLVPEDTSDVSEGGEFHKNTSSILREFFNAYMMQRPLAAGSRMTIPQRKERARTFVSRVNVMAKRERVALCPVCESVAFERGSQYDIGGLEVCENCFQLHAHCPDCDARTYFRRAEMLQGEDGEFRCRTHPPVFNDPRDGRLMGYTTVVTDRKPKSFALADGEKKADLWLGWELECYPTPGNIREHVVQDIRAIFADYCIVKADSTIQEGMEIVSVPATLQWHREHTVPFLKALHGKIEGWKYNNAGIHIHIGRAELSPLQIGRMSAFVDHPANSPFITKIAGRDPTTYCNRVLKKLTIGLHDANNMERYCALNLKTRNLQTVEYRIFRSNVSPLGFLKCLELCHALARWAKDCGNQECAPYRLGQRMTGANRHERYSPAWDVQEQREKTAMALAQRSTASVDAFVAWAVKHRGEYPVLHRWLQENQYASGARYEPVSVGA